MKKKGTIILLSISAIILLWSLANLIILAITMSATQDPMHLVLISASETKMFRTYFFIYSFTYTLSLISSAYGIVNLRRLHKRK